MPSYLGCQRVTVALNPRPENLSHSVLQLTKEQSRLRSLSLVPRPVDNVYGGFPKLRVPFWGSSNKDYSIWGSILGLMHIIFTVLITSLEIYMKFRTPAGFERLRRHEHQTLSVGTCDSQHDVAML